MQTSVSMQDDVESVAGTAKGKGKSSKTKQTTWKGKGTEACVSSCVVESMVPSRLRHAQTQLCTIVIHVVCRQALSKDSSVNKSKIIVLLLNSRS